jgi:hypothetical protein
MGNTEKIWEEAGKTWLDRAEVETKDGRVNVTSAERVPLARIADGIWGYRRKGEVAVVVARDSGFLEEGASWECRVAESVLAAPAGTTIIDSSPNDANLAMRERERWMRESGQKHAWHPDWSGVQLRVMASVSKAESDPAPILSLVIRRP